MILPTKSIKSVDSLFCISSCIIEVTGDQELTIDEIHERINQSYPKKINIEILLMCLNFLFIIGKLERNNETIKIKL